MKLLRFAFVVLGVLCLAPAALFGQNADVLTGKVTGEDGLPVVGARVTAVSIETEISRSVLTDKNGRYMINFPDGGGRYVLRITFIGMADVVKTVVRDSDEELLLTNVQIPRPFSCRRSRSPRIVRCQDAGKRVSSPPSCRRRC
jgi:hypothetical protein